MAVKMVFEDGENVTLHLVQEAIEKCAHDEGVPVAFYNEKVKFGQCH